MALEWDAVEKIRAAQMRRDPNTLPETDANLTGATSSAGTAAGVARLTDTEALIFKIRAQLIDYIVAHGLVDGLVFDGTLRATESGKIVITSEMIDVVVDALGYYKEPDVLAFIEDYLPDHHYVADADYVHTDNNYDNDAVSKLAGIEDGAEVNKIIDLIFNGSTAVDPETRVATITITPEMIKEWYESNDDTNAFTGIEKAELAHLWERLDALEAKVDDVQLDGESIVKNKVAYLTALKIKNSYESNPDTNAYTDAAKAIVESIPALRTRVETDEARIDELERTVVVLRNDLTAETEARTTEDANLENRIEAEAAKRSEDDLVILDKITNLTNDLTRTKDTITELAKDVAFTETEEVSGIYIPQEKVDAIWLDRVDDTGTVASKSYVRVKTEDDPDDTNDGDRVVNKSYVKTAIANMSTTISVTPTPLSQSLIVGVNDPLSEDSPPRSYTNTNVSDYVTFRDIFFSGRLDNVKVLNGVCYATAILYPDEDKWLMEYSDDIDNYTLERKLVTATSKTDWYLSGFFDATDINIDITKGNIDTTIYALDCPAIISAQIDSDIHGSTHSSNGYFELPIIFRLPDEVEAATIESADSYTIKGNVSFLGTLSFNYVEEE